MREPAVFDIFIDRKATFDLVLLLKDDVGAAIDLTGHTITAKAGGGPLAVGNIDLNPSLSGTPTDGQVTLVIDEAVTEGYSETETIAKSNRSTWDLLDDDGGAPNKVDKLITGVCTIRESQAGTEI